LYAGAVAKVARVLVHGWVEVAERDVVDQKPRQFGDRVDRFGLRFVLDAILTDHSRQNR
tara:strand:+ start:323 stop:499 length:177 start_codon:yes stop_codon:yes gene_type:complete